MQAESKRHNAMRRKHFTAPATTRPVSVEVEIAHLRDLDLKGLRAS
jgi:hypothetical protein